MKFYDLHVGQKVVVAYTTGNGFYSSREGKTGTVVELDEGASLDVMLSFDEPGVDNDWGQSRELEVAEEYKALSMSDLHIGLRVRVREERGGFFNFNVGKVGTVVELDRGDELMPVRVKFDGEGFDWGRPGGLELIEQDVRTPAQKAGLVIGEKYRIVPHVVDGSSHYRVPVGSVVTFIEDDETSCPRFLTEEGVRHFIHLERIGEKYKPTPAEEAGFKVGDQAVVIDDECGFKAGQLVTLFSDDGSTCPTWKGENTRYNNAGGEPGAYASVSNMRKVDVAEQAKGVQELEAKVKRLNALLQAARDLLN